ncbi:L-threonylcarbamoyladenylate synthase [Methanopyrus sp.]
MLEEENPNAVKHVIRTLRAGKLVAIPCDTVYSLSCDATNSEAVRRLFAAKERPADKPVSVAVHSPEKALELLEPIPGLEAVLETLTPGPVTIVAPRKPGMVAPEVAAGKRTLGIRIPDHPFFLRVVRRFGRPIVTTSANISGQPAPTDPDEVLEQLGDRLDLLVEGECRFGEPSTVIELTPEGNIDILREGAVPKEKILEMLRGTTSGA